MTAFKYEALDAAGKSTAGIVEADTPKAARTQLRTLRLVPLAVTPVVMTESAKSGGRNIFSRKAF
jgi:general secretion pathway protein F